MLWSQCYVGDYIKAGMLVNPFLYSLHAGLHSSEAAARQIPDIQTLADERCSRSRAHCELDSCSLVIGVQS